MILFYMPASLCSLLSSTPFICHGTSTMCALRSHSFLTVTHSKFMTQIFSRSFLFYTLAPFCSIVTLVCQPFVSGICFPTETAGVVSAVAFFPMSTITFNVFPFVSTNSSHFFLLSFFNLFVYCIAAYFVSMEFTHAIACTMKNQEKEK